MDYLDELIQLQRATGIYTHDLNNKELREITWSNIYNTAAPNNNLRILFHEFKPKTYKDMTAFVSSCHNSHSWHKDDYNAIDKMCIRDRFMIKTYSNMQGGFYLCPVKMHINSPLP